MTTWLLGCSQPKGEVATVAEAIVRSVPWEDGVLFVGEQHQSIVSSSLVIAAVQSDRVDCVFFETPDAPDSLESRVDAFMMSRDDGVAALSRYA